MSEDERQKWEDDGGPAFDLGAMLDSAEESAEREHDLEDAIDGSDDDNAV